MATKEKDEAEAAAAALATSAAMQQAAVDKERLKTDAIDREGQYLKAGNVVFEYTVRETTQESEILYSAPGEPTRYGTHRMVHREKGSRESLPRPVAERKQRQGLGKILGEDDPYEITTMRDVVLRDPLAPQPDIAVKGK